MALSEREAFKVGFLARCAEAGLGPEEALGAVKRAGDKLAGVLGDAASVARVGGGALAAAAPLALLAPPLVGGLAGAGLASATDIEDADVDAVKDQEVVSAMRTESARLRRQKAVRDYARARAATGRMFA